MSTPAQKKRVAVLISGRGSNMAALIAAANAPDYPAEIALVLSNRPEAAGLKHAERAGIAVKAIDHKAFADRERFDAAMQAELDRAGIELVCCAGFMRILTSDFVESWEGRMLNIHPSLLPLFRGTHTHLKALAAGVRLHGCTVHFVVPELDAGPIVAQAAVPVHPDDDPETLAARVLAQERRLYPAALRLVASDQVRLEDGRARFADGLPPVRGALLAL